MVTSLTLGRAGKAALLVCPWLLLSVPLSGAAQTLDCHGNGRAMAEAPSRILTGQGIAVWVQREKPGLGMLGVGWAIHNLTGDILRVKLDKTFYAAPSGRLVARMVGSDWTEILVQPHETLCGGRLIGDDLHLWNDFFYGDDLQKGETIGRIEVSATVRNVSAERRAEEQAEARSAAGNARAELEGLRQDLIAAGNSGRQHPALATAIREAQSRYSAHGRALQSARSAAELERLEAEIRSTRDGLRASVAEEASAAADRERDRQEELDRAREEARERAREREETTRQVAGVLSDLSDAKVGTGAMTGEVLGQTGLVMFDASSTVDDDASALGMQVGGRGRMLFDVGHRMRLEVGGRASWMFGSTAFGNSFSGADTINASYGVNTYGIMFDMTALEGLAQLWMGTLGLGVRAETRAYGITSEETGDRFTERQVAMMPQVSGGRIGDKPGYWMISFYAWPLSAAREGAARIVGLEFEYAVNMLHFSGALVDRRTPQARHLGSDGQIVVAAGMRLPW